MSHVLASLYWLPVCFRSDFKVLFCIYKSLNGQTYVPYQRHSGQLTSSLSSHWDWTTAFAALALKLWNKSPVFKPSQKKDVFQLTVRAAFVYHHPFPGSINSQTIFRLMFRTEGGIVHLCKRCIVRLLIQKSDFIWFSTQKRYKILDLRGTCESSGKWVISRDNSPQQIFINLQKRVSKSS